MHLIAPGRDDSGFRNAIDRNGDGADLLNLPFPLLGQWFAGHQETHPFEIEPVFLPGHAHAHGRTRKRIDDTVRVLVQRHGGPLGDLERIVQIGVLRFGKTDAVQFGH